jgi:hypothetical protein
VGERVPTATGNGAREDTDEGLSAPFDHALTMTTTVLKLTSRGSVARGRAP